MPAGMPGIGQYCPKSTGMASTQPVFKPVQNVGVLIPVYVLVWYIPAGTSTVSTTLDGKHDLRIL